MLLGDQFLVTLPSNVKTNDKTRPGQYETTLATPWICLANGKWR